MGGGRKADQSQSASTTSVHRELTGEVRKMVAAVERGGLVRHELSLPKGMSANKTYQRGSVGATMA